MLRTFKHSGDRGDIIYSLPTVRVAGGGELFLARSTFTRVKTDQSTFDDMAPLLQAQPYITGVDLYQGQAVAFDLDLFRTVGGAMENIAVRHLRAFGLPETEADTAWLAVGPEKVAPVVINRTARYQNVQFPWQEVVDKYGKDCVFVGLEEEHAAFCAKFGEIQYWHTQHILRLAQVIAGADLFIGNQSLACAIAEGLKKPIIQEVSLDLPNCMFKRKCFQAVCDSRAILPDLPKSRQPRTISGAGAGTEVKSEKAPAAPSTCIVQLGRYGDILNILPVAKAIADAEGGKVGFMAHLEYADILDGCSYIQARSTDLSFTKPDLAAQVVQDEYSRVIVPQINNTERATYRLTESFSTEQWRLAGFSHQWGKLPLIIDRRNPEREQALLDSIGITDEPFVAVNLSGVSSPYPQAEPLMDEIRRRFAWTIKIVDLSKVRAKKFFDLLAILDRAAVLVTVDTATLHLAAASKVPVIALISDTPDLWAGSKPRCNVTLSMRYKEAPHRTAEILVCIAKQLPAIENLQKIQQSPETANLRLPAQPVEKLTRFFHSGDLGDIVYGLLFASTLKPIELILGPEPQIGTRVPMTRKTFEWIKPLLESQPWIQTVSYAEAMPEVDYNLNLFRKTCFKSTRRSVCLFQAYPEHFKTAPLPEDIAWLKVEPKVIPGKPVVIARSARYRNSLFPWKKVAAMYAGRMIFVGLKEEFEGWQSSYGPAAEYYPVQDALEMAQVIAGAKLFIGNQSFPNSLALALNVPLVQETFATVPDCVLHRPNAIYSTGPVNFPEIPAGIMEQAKPVVVSARRALPISLVAIDTFEPDKSISAMCACRREVSFTNCTIVCRTGARLSLGKADGINPVFLDVGPDRVDREKILIHRLHEFIDGTHCLHIEHDSRIANPAAWCDEWLQYDFIGAPWPWPVKQDGFPPILEGNCVGNTGFALISKRFAEAVSSIAKPNVQEARMSDAYICRTLRPQLEQMGLRFAPESVAERFSCENRYYHGQFGWHGRGTAALNGFKVTLINRNDPVAL